MTEQPPKRRFWQRVGNDGLTNAQRRFYAKRWREGAGAPATPEEVARLKKIFRDKHRNP